MIPPLAIDDFEDGDTFPTSGAFAQWQCYAWGPIQQAFGCDLRAPGYNSNFAQFLIFELTDPANGSQDLPGSGLRSVVKVGTLDLSSYVRVVFSALLEPQPPAGLPTSTLVNVRLGCSSAASGFPPPGGFAVFAPITPLTTWSTLSIKLADFKPGTGGSPLDPSACLELVDGLDFQLVPQQPDDSVAMARFSIDTVYFQ